MLLGLLVQHYISYVFYINSNCSKYAICSVIFVTFSIIWFLILLESLILQSKMGELKYNIISEVVFYLGIVLNLGSHFMEFLHFSDKWKTCLLYLYEQMNISCFAWCSLCSVKFISWMLMHVCVDVMCVYANVLDMCFLFKLRSLGYDVMWCMNFDIT